MKRFFNNSQIQDGVRLFVLLAANVAWLSGMCLALASR